MFHHPKKDLLPDTIEIYEGRHHHPTNITITIGQVKVLKFKVLIHIQVKRKYGGGGSLRMKPLL